MELSILDAIQTNLGCDFLDVVMPRITALGNKGAVWIGITFLLLLFPKTRRAGVTAAIGLVLELLVCNLALKPLVARTRPCDINTAVSLLIARPRDFSFPSGHTGASFAVVSALYFRQNRLWIPGLVLAVLIGFSRLYLYVHYPSDVLAGALIGILSGWIGSLLTGSSDRIDRTK
ncbi:MAG: phosphatase PAP2 family protein [Eubacteriales bacterium]|nr:phosphatase PAP2 family protein [Eubacteriales bacterium]